MIGKLTLAALLAMGTGLAMAAGAPAPAMADKAAAGCPATPGQWLGQETIRHNLQDLGYRVGKIEVEHGCYEAAAVNDSGFQLELSYDPVSGELIAAPLKS